jgi:hypothetical protein
MAEQARQIRNLLGSMEEEMASIQRALEEAQMEITRLNDELENRERQCYEAEMDLINSDSALERILEENRQLKDMMVKEGIFEEEEIRSIKPKAHGVICETCRDELIWTEIGKRFCNKCYRLWKIEHGQWRSGTWRSKEEKEKERRKSEEKNREEIRNRSQNYEF